MTCASAQTDTRVETGEGEKESGVRERSQQRAPFSDYLLAHCSPVSLDEHALNSNE